MSDSSARDAPVGAVESDQDPAAPASSEAGTGPTCACGHDREHFMVSPEPQYTGLDWVWVVFGITTIPHEVQFKCRRCGQTFDRTRDDKLMRRYI